MGNTALARMLGYVTTVDLINARFTDLVAGTEPDRATFLDEVTARGSVAGVESTWRRRDGSALTVWESVRVVLDDAGRPVFFEGTVEDITERKEIEAAVGRNEARFRALIERNADAIVVVDREGTILPTARRSSACLGLARMNGADAVCSKLFIPEIWTGRGAILRAAWPIPARW